MRLGALLLALAAVAAAPPTPTTDRFDEHAAWRWLVRQVELGPRPAGSAASRALAVQLRAALPRGSFENVPGGLRNVVGVVPGRDPSRTVVVGAHYDTKDAAGFVGANDGASGTAVVVELARSIRPRQIGPTVIFVLFDGEESPAGTPEARFVDEGLRGSKVAAARHHGAEAMILLDLVGDRDLQLPRERLSKPALWSRLRAAAGRVGTAGVFPRKVVGGVYDDHWPFLEEGVPAVDLIDLDYACWHRRCDDLRHVSLRSLDIAGETVYELLRTF